jgi:hypothetical protein
MIIYSLFDDPSLPSTAGAVDHRAAHIHDRADQNGWGGQGITRRSGRLALPCGRRTPGCYATVPAKGGSNTLKIGANCGSCRIIVFIASILKIVETGKFPQDERLKTWAPSCRALAWCCCSSR